MVQHIMERKLNLFGHICRMKDKQAGEEEMFGTMEGDLAENSWMISRSGLERKFIYSAGRRRIKAYGEQWCGRHWTPTNGEPMEQWMDKKCWTHASWIQRVFTSI